MEIDGKINNNKPLLDMVDKLAEEDNYDKILLHIDAMITLYKEKPINNDLFIKYAKYCIMEESLYQVIKYLKIEPNSDNDISSNVVIKLSELIGDNMPYTINQIRLNNRKDEIDKVVVKHQKLAQFIKLCEIIKNIKYLEETVND